ncbi:MAG: FeoB-associated Cys-rich membrane protein [Clostridia bacterium]|nr:FeoB-associated Cys-rich membrane protein [Clostridia bacterium]
MNIWDVLIGAAVIAALLVALLFMNKNKDSGCSGSCSACSMAGSCHKENKDK